MITATILAIAAAWGVLFVALIVLITLDSHRGALFNLNQQSAPVRLARHISGVHVQGHHTPDRMS